MNQVLFHLKQIGSIVALVSLSWNGYAQPVCNAVNSQNTLPLLSQIPGSSGEVANDVWVDNCVSLKVHTNEYGLTYSVESSCCMVVDCQSTNTVPFIDLGSGNWQPVSNPDVSIVKEEDIYYFLAVYYNPNDQHYYLQNIAWSH